MYVHDVISKRKTCIDNKVYIRVDSMILTFQGKRLSESHLLEGKGYLGLFKSNGQTPIIDFISPCQVE